MKRALALLLVLASLLVWAMLPKGVDTPLPGALETLGLPSPDGAVTMTFLGTSLTRDLPRAALENALTNCLKHPVTVQIIAKGGETSRWGLTQIEQVIASAPDLLFMEFTINDADLRRRVSLSESAKNHRALLDAVSAALPGTRIVLLRLNRAYGTRALLRPRQAAYDRQLTAFDRPILDLRPEWSARGKDALPDGIHPTPEAVHAITLPALTRAISTDPACRSKG